MEHPKVIYVVVANIGGIPIIEPRIKPEDANALRDTFESAGAEAKVMEYKPSEN